MQFFCSYQDTQTRSPPPANRMKARTVCPADRTYRSGALDTGMRPIPLWALLTTPFSLSSSSVFCKIRFSGEFLVSMTPLKCDLALPKNSKFVLVACLSKWNANFKSVECIPYVKSLCLGVQAVVLNEVTVNFNRSLPIGSLVQSLRDTAVEKLFWTANCLLHESIKGWIFG